MSLPTLPGVQDPLTGFQVAIFAAWGLGWAAIVAALWWSLGDE